MTGPKPIPTARTIAEQRALFPPDYEYDYFDDTRPHPFDLRAETYSPVNAWWLIELSFLAYASGEGFFRRHLEPVGLADDLRLIGFTRRIMRSTQCIVVSNRTDIFVVFRGTLVSEPWDVVVDGLSFPVRWSGAGRAHLGFVSAVNEVWDEVRQTVQAIQSPAHSVWFTGHSLGAAVATLAADRYQREAGPVRGLYAFGSPRVGDPAFAAAFAVPAYRVVNHADPVARVPPARVPILAGTRQVFRHVGQPIYIDGRGRVHHRAPPTDRRPVSQEHELTFRQRLGLKGRRMVKAAADHAPKCYAVRLWNALLAAT